MIGRVVEDDLFGIAARLKSIDDGYFVLLNYKTGKYEVHNRKQNGNTLCLVCFDKLDERTVRKVRATRAERIRSVLEAMERENAKRELAAKSAALNKVACAL